MSPPLQIRQATPPTPPPSAPGKPAPPPSRPPLRPPRPPATPRAPRHAPTPPRASGRLRYRFSTTFSATLIVVTSPSLFRSFGTCATPNSTRPANPTSDTSLPPSNTRPADG